QSTKNDLIKFYKVDENKIMVAHLGYDVGASFSRPLLDSGGQARPLQQPYILFLSTLQPRKNLEGLIEAFKQLKTENPELPHKLVVVGRPGWKFEDIVKKIDENKDIVVYLNHVSDEDRFVILGKADLLVLPSFYEGFGMTILEAFSAGVPVATSNVSSMSEVAGEAAVYFDPRNIAEIKNAIKSVLLDKSLSENLKTKGLARLKDFSWQKCAAETLKILTDNYDR
ncbi:MAG: glycosyltransferase family 4 protein, partial [Candidatus Paceibacterales bacterium]